MIGCALAVSRSPLGRTEALPTMIRGAVRVSARVKFGVKRGYGRGQGLGLRLQFRSESGLNSRYVYHTMRSASIWPGLQRESA